MSRAHTRLFAGALGASWLALVASGCATGRPAAPAADPAVELGKLRSENAAYARKVEELENQVFILNDEVSARRAGDPPPPAAVTPPPLPEVKLSPGAHAPAPEPASGDARPESLVDETVVEYSGAAAERKAKRPLLKLWGADGQSSGSIEETSAPAETAAAVAPVRERRRRAEPPAAAPTAAPAPMIRPAAPPPSPPSARNDDGMRAYKTALELVQSRRHDEAVSALRAFVKTYPEHDYADNAQYWLGECFYDRQDYSTALREFRRVVDRFPTGNKVPDALLKTAFSYLALGSARPGRDTLVQITREHPRHPAASLAAAKLAELDGKGHSSAPAATGGRVSAAAVSSGR